MTHGSLFSGIGGFDLAAEWMGWENVFHCEWNPFGQKVLNHYWPNSISYNDITKTDFTIHRGKIDIISGGFPCQPYSHAGKRLGKEDERHLWPEMLRAIREIQPTWVVGENVSGLISWNGGLVFDEVQTDLEAEGYEVFPVVLPAAGVGSCPHRRDRVWFIAYSKDNDARRKQSKCCERKNSTQIGGRFQHEFTGNGINGPTTNPNGSKRCKRRLHTPEPETAKRHVSPCNARSYKRPTWENFPTQSPVRTGNDGLSSRLDGITFSKWRNESIKAAGNAVVPQVVFQIFKAIQQMTNQQTL